MFVRVDNRILNLDNIVEVRIFPATEARYLTDEEAAEWDYPPDNYLRGTALKVQIETTVMWGGGADGETDLKPYPIVLQGLEAEKFLAVIPVYDATDIEVEA